MTTRHGLSPVPAHAPATRASLPRFFSNHIDALITAVSVFAASRLFLLMSQAPMQFGGTLLDDSWVADLIARSARREWLGRDAIFTYGPLFQWLCGWPARRLGVSLETIQKTWNVVPYGIGILLIYAALNLLLRREPGWKRGLLMLLSAVFWYVPDIRTGFELFAFALSFSLVTAVPTKEVRAWCAAAALAITVITGFLISADTGCYALGAVMVVYATVGVVHVRIRPALRQLATFACAFAILLGICILAVNLWAGRSWNFHFWVACFAVLSSYRWVLAETMEARTRLWMVLVIAPALATLAYYACRGNRNEPASTEDRVYAKAGLLFALLTLQSAFVRSDVGHVMVAQFATIVLAATALFRSRTAGGRGAVLAVVLLSVWFYPANQVFSFWTLMADFRRSQTVSTECADGQVYVDGLCFWPPEGTALQRVVADLKENARADDKVAVFPYENIVGVAARLPVVAPVIQNYQIGGTYLMSEQLRGLETAEPAWAVYFADGISAMALDGVPNFSRAPEVWFYLQRHYRTERESAPGVFVLHREEAHAQEWKTAESELMTKPAEYRIRGSKSTLDLGRVYWPADGADFLKMDLTLQYPFWWKVAKPSRIGITLQHLDGSSKNAWLVIPPNSRHSVWVYPWDEARLATYFSPPSRKLTDNSPVQQVWLTIQPYDWISVRPSALTVHGMEAVRLQHR